MSGVAGPVRVVDAVAAGLGESPMWRPGDGLWYVDIAGRALHRLDPATGARARHAFASEVASAAPRADGSGFLLARRDGLWTYDPETGDESRLAPPPVDPAEGRFNDGKCDPAGRFWIGTVFDARRPEAGLWCWDGHRLVRHQGGVTTANGLAWSPDGRTMYWSDTAAHVVWAFDFDVDGGRMRERRVFARFATRDGGRADAYAGRPDGAAVDTEGCYWVAMYEGGRVLRLAPSGEVVETVSLPVRCPTMPCFGGPDLKTVYVTSARAGRSADELARCPASGAVLAFEVGVPGLPTPVFREAPA